MKANDTPRSRNMVLKTEGAYFGSIYKGVDEDNCIFGALYPSRILTGLARGCGGSWSLAKPLKKTSLEHGSTASLLSILEAVALVCIACRQCNGSKLQPVGTL